MDSLIEILKSIENLFTPESIAHYVEIMGPLIYIFIFIIAFFESFIFTGLIIPGTIMLVAMGFIASQGPINFLMLFILTSIAAILGDMLNFYLGKTKGADLIIAVSGRFKIKTDYLKIGEEFFKAHGNKSVFIGRFVALIRPFIPFIAGIFKMPWRIFLFWNVLSGFIWAGIYLTLGYFFGRALDTIVQWSGRAGIIILILLIFILLTHFIKDKVMRSIS